MRYMLLIYGEEQAWTDAGAAELLRQVNSSLCSRSTPTGIIWPATPLHPVSTATSVRIRDGKRGFLVTDNIAETREQLGGYYLIDARDLDEAIAIAARIPAARKGTVEIRPVVELEGLPEMAERVKG